jgi:osmoprotectant transport system permease protein
MKKTVGIAVTLLLSASIVLPLGCSRRPDITIGSKAFLESWILGEVLCTLARSSGALDVRHQENLGGTKIVYEALLGGDVDAYPEYTGTISEVILKSTGRPTFTEMRQALAKDGVGMSDSFGFHNGYALAVTLSTQQKYDLHRISDLLAHPALRLGLTHEFVGRRDGYPGLASHYGLDMKHVRGIEHQLAYSAISSGQIDVMDVYTTDAQIKRLDLRLLEDDRSFFPRYDAVLLYRLSLKERAGEALAAMERLTGKIDEALMIRANARVMIEGQETREAAAALLAEGFGARAFSALPREALVGKRSIAGDILWNTLHHLRLVGLSLLAAILLGLPLGILATRSRVLASITLSSAGLLQTIPSIALLGFLVPLLGIGVAPTLLALFLYSLLPIVRNTFTGLKTLSPGLLEAAEALGLRPGAQLFLVRLPLASPSIMAGIKTSAVINVGTATVAAFIGAGGLGDPILQGIHLSDTSLILQGAIPAAALALLVELGFHRLDRVVIPRGLRLRK